MSLGANVLAIYVEKCASNISKKDSKLLLFKNGLDEFRLMSKSVHATFPRRTLEEKDTKLQNWKQSDEKQSIDARCKANKTASGAVMVETKPIHDADQDCLTEKKDTRQ